MERRNQFWGRFSAFWLISVSEYLRGSTFLELSLLIIVRTSFSSSSLASLEEYISGEDVKWTFKEQTEQSNENHDRHNTTSGLSWTEHFLDNTKSSDCD